MSGPNFMPGAIIVAVYRGTVTVNEATAVEVADPRITADSVVVFGLSEVGGTPAGAPYMFDVTPGEGFEVKAAAGDTSTYTYMILN